MFGRFHEFSTTLALQILILKALAVHSRCLIYGIGSPWSRHNPTMKNFQSLNQGPSFLARYWQGSFGYMWVMY